MIFAIDFDGTFARDPEFFIEMTVTGRARGHKFVIVTGRSDEGQWGAEVLRVVAGRLPIVFAGSNWKREAAEAAGWKVDVWIDDNPEYVARQNMIGRDFGKT